MSTSLLYHAFGIRGYRYQSTAYEEGAVIFTITQDRLTLRCPECNGRNIICRGVNERELRTVPIGGKRAYVRIAVQRVWCLWCAAVRQVRLKFAEERVSYTKAFERYALELSRHMTIQDVARHLGISWDVVKDIQKRQLQRKFSRPKLAGLTHLAIDEIYIGKGHKYVTVVLDIDSGAVVYVGDGKGTDALKPFWRRLLRSGARIQAVAIDMSPAYIAAVSAHVPAATLVFDHFHIVKLFNEKLSNFRRDLYHKLTNESDRIVLKGTRWLLLKNPENLDATRNEQQRLQEALQINAPLATVYYMKEDLRTLWNHSGKVSAGRFLDDWIARAKASGIRMLQSFAETLHDHREGILAWYDHPISTGPLEGTNNKIVTMKRQAYGFRDIEFFKLKIMAIHQSKYALVG
jgi:transposase